MSKIQQVSDAIVAQGMLPLYFNADQEVTIEILRALYRAGIKAIEYTSRGEAALSNFTKMVETCNLMVTKNLKPYPEIYQYVYSVYSFVKGKPLIPI